MADQEDFRILVTGFGAFQEITSNPSFAIVSQLPASIPAAAGNHNNNSNGGDQIQVIAHSEPLPAVYSALLEASPRLIRERRPDVVLHVGLAADRDYFAVERGADRDGYHEVPDMARAVLPKAQTSRALWGKKSAARLDSALDLDAAVEAWRRNLKKAAGGAGTGTGAGGQKKQKDKGKGGNGRNGGTRSVSSSLAKADVRLSDDVGNYVCGLVYYASLAEMAKSEGKTGSAVFLHIPPLPTDEDIQMGLEVVKALIQALAEVWRHKKIA